MIDFSAVCWLLVVGFWCGFGYRVWGEKQAQKAVHGLEPHPSHIQFAAEFVAATKSLKRSRKFVGEGVSIANVQNCEVKGVGKFRVTIEEAEEVDA